MQDGSEADRKFDLTITTKETVKVGDIVIFEGKIALNKEENEELSNSYNMERKLTKEELESIKNDLKEGRESFRRDVISLGFDDKLTTKEQIEIIRESYNSFNDDFKKNPQNIIINIHNNTDHKHALRIVTGKQQQQQQQQQQDRKSTRLNSSHRSLPRMPSSA